MKYLGYTLSLDGGRYTVHSPEGVRVGTFNDATSARRWVREHRAAASRLASATGDGAAVAPEEQGQGSGSDAVARSGGRT